MTYDRIDYLETVFGGMTIGRYLNAILSQFMTKDKLDEITAFFEKRPIKQAERSIAQGKLSIQTMILSPLLFRLGNNQNCIRADQSRW